MGCLNCFHRAWYLGRLELFLAGRPTYLNACAGVRNLASLGLYFDLKEWALALRVTIADPWSVRLAVGPVAFEFGGYPG